MGTKLQLDNNYSMRDLNHDSSGTNWPSYCGENNLPNVQYYYSPLSRPVPELFLGVDKDLLKQKMLEHEAVFKNQVFELHRLYRVQKDLMDEVRKKEQYKHKIPCETSSSSSALASQTTPKESHMRNSSSFLFPSTACGGPPVSDPESIGSSGGPLKGKGVQGDLILLHNCASPKNSEVSKIRPTKLRKMIDLQLPADEYEDMDEVEQLASKSDSCLRKPNALADLNEPLECEEAFASPEYLNGAHNSSLNTDKGSGQNWFSSLLKSGGIKDNGKSIDQANHSEKATSRARSVQVGSASPSTLTKISHFLKEDQCPADASYTIMFNHPGVSTASHLPYALNSDAGLRNVNGNHSDKGTRAFDLNVAFADDSSDEVKQEDPVSIPPWLRRIDSGKEKVLFDMNMPCDDPEDFDNIAPTSEISRPMIDLNSCLTDVDLEAEEKTNPLMGSTDGEDEKLAMVAAEAIVALSSSHAPDSPADDFSAEAIDPLRWFADLACSNPDGNPDSGSSEPDYLEEMTLKLTECTVEEYFPKPPSFYIQVEETGNGPNGPNSLMGRPRRGPARRGRQRKDFQRDILPGLTSLARHEVSEDLQTFGGLMKATGHAWQSGSRRSSSGRGRRRAVVLAVSPPPPPPPPARVMESEVMVLEGSWGKTRRPRRQRCPSAAGRAGLLPV